MKYDGINWMGWLVIITIALCYCGMCFLLLGYGAIIWLIFSVIVVFYALINVDNDTDNQSAPLNNHDFTDEDFIYCKLGEWVSRL